MAKLKCDKSLYFLLYGVSFYEVITWNSGKLSC